MNLTKCPWTCQKPPNSRRVTMVIILRESLLNVTYVTFEMSLFETQDGTTLRTHTSWCAYGAQS